MIKQDAFAVSDDLLPAEDAIDRLCRAVSPVAQTEIVSLADALGRTLAADVISDRTSPPHDNSAVDGYAVRRAELPGDGMKSFPVSLRIPAGAVPGAALGPGRAARIFTGAPIPEGADTVIPQEVCEADEAGGTVRLPPMKKAGANLRKAGEDVVAGATAIPKGRRLRPQEIGLAASLGCARVRVHRRLRVAVFSTGDEIRDPTGDAPPGCIFDANRHALAALLRSLGCEPVDCGILADRPETVTAALRDMPSGVDAILTSGGISTGDEDHVKTAVEALGRLDFWRVAIRPGRPIAFGTIDAKPFIGLPGNPVATMVCFMIFVRPLLLTLMGRTEVAPQRVRLPSGFSQGKRIGRREWLRGWIETDADGRQMVQKFRTAGSGILTSMTQSQGLVELPEARERIEPGDPLDFLPFDSLLV